MTYQQEIQKATLLLATVLLQHDIHPAAASAALANLLANQAAQADNPKSTMDTLCDLANAHLEEYLSSPLVQALRKAQQMQAAQAEQNATKQTQDILAAAAKRARE